MLCVLFFFFYKEPVLEVPVLDFEKILPDLRVFDIYNPELDPAIDEVNKRIREFNTTKKFTSEFNLDTIPKLNKVIRDYNIHKMQFYKDFYNNDDDKIIVSGFIEEDQLLFSDSAAVYMNGIIDFHNVLFSYFFLIMCFVTSGLLFCLYNFTLTKISYTDLDIFLFVDEIFFKVQSRNFLINFKKIKELKGRGYSKNFAFKFPLKVSSFIKWYFFKNMLKSETIFLYIFLNIKKLYFSKVVSSNLRNLVQLKWLEFCWTVIPIFIIFLIAVPSMILLYAGDEHLTPVYNFRIIGNQWYWTYEFTKFIPMISGFSFITNLELTNLKYLNDLYNVINFDGEDYDNFGNFINKKSLFFVSDIEHNLNLYKVMKLKFFERDALQNTLFSFCDFNYILDNTNSFNLNSKNFTIFIYKQILHLNNLSNLNLDLYLSSIEIVSEALNNYLLYDNSLLYDNLYIFKDSEPCEIIINWVNSLNSLCVLGSCDFFDSYLQETNNFFESIAIFWSANYYSKFFTEFGSLYIFDYIFDNVNFVIYDSFKLNLFNDMLKEWYGVIRKPHIYSWSSYMLSDAESRKIGLPRLLAVDKPLIVPARVPIKFHISALDVIHSFAVPVFGIKVDAIPGRLNSVSLFIEREGMYYGQCSEICGANHGFMPIGVLAVDYKDFMNFINNL